MKYNLDAVLVVEGKSDVSYLSIYINAYYFTTNGYDINDTKLDLLSRASCYRKIIILTDPDDAGETIRNKIVTRIKPAIVIKIEKNSRKNYKKSGVAESHIEEIISLLKPHFINEQIKIIDYKLNQSLMGENGSALKEEIIRKYRLINGNTKSIENQLNILDVSKEEIDEFFKEKLC